MEPSKIHYLFEQYYQKTCTDAEKNELMDIVRNDANDEELKQILDSWIIQTNAEYKLPETTSNSMLKAILDTSRIIPLHKRFRKLSIAAAVFVLIGCAGIIHLIINKTSFSSTQKDKRELEHTITQIIPRGKHATFTTASGQIIQLDSSIGKQLNIDGTIATINNNGELEIRCEPLENTVTGFNTISTTKGAQYKIVLPDGSKVWLNTSSSLRFPQVFAANERIVELTGEGYFEIQKNPHAPFKIQTPQGATIDVLGTSFNVNAYLGEQSVDATLLDGSIQIGKGSKTQMLKPGEQAVLMNALKDNIEVKEVDTEYILAWKNDLFSFKETPLHVALRQMERWYDIEIQYKGNSKDILVNGIISRNQPLSAMLEMFEYTLNLHHKIEDRKIILY